MHSVHFLTRAVPERARHAHARERTRDPAKDLAQDSDGKILMGASAAPRCAALGPCMRAIRPSLTRDPWGTMCAGNDRPPRPVLPHYRRRHPSGRQWPSQLTFSIPVCALREERGTGEAGAHARVARLARLRDIEVHPVAPLGNGVSAAAIPPPAAAAPANTALPTTTARRRWQAWEDANLNAGMAAHGNAWATILVNYAFDNRSQVDLKDRARTLQKHMDKASPA
jgi:hypothetical protein